MQKRANSTARFSIDHIPPPLHSPGFWPDDGSDDYFSLPVNDYYGANSSNHNGFLSGWACADGIEHHGPPGLCQPVASGPPWPWSQVGNSFIADMPLPSPLSPLSQGCDHPLMSECNEVGFTLLDDTNDMDMEPVLEQKIESALSDDRMDLVAGAAHESKRKNHQLSSDKVERCSTSTSICPAMTQVQINVPRDIGRCSRTASYPNPQMKQSVQTHNLMRTKSASMTKRPQTRTEKSNKDTSRTAHNMIERRYRNHLNNQFATLLSSLPQDFIKANTSGDFDSRKFGEDNDGTRCCKTVSKRNVLELAAQYIKNLETVNGELLGERNDLKNSLNRFSYAS